MRYRLNNLVYIFLLTSFFGWMMESIGTSVIKKKFSNRGSINLPFCVIYGFSIILLFLIIKTPQIGIWRKIKYKIKNKVIANIMVIILYCACCFVICFLVEYLTGYFIDKYNLERQWDYSGDKGNFNGYIKWSFTVLFAAGATLYMLIVFPFFYYQSSISKPRTIIINNIIIVTLIAIEYIFLFTK